MTQNIPSLGINATQFTNRGLNSITASIEFGESCNGCYCARKKSTLATRRLTRLRGQLGLPAGNIPPGQHYPIEIRRLIPVYDKCYVPLSSSGKPAATKLTRCAMRAMDWFSRPASSTYRRVVAPSGTTPKPTSLLTKIT